MTLGTVIHRLDSVPSTNDVALRLVRDGAAHGTVVAAEEQTRGRGTKGRGWHSPRGRGLYASFILRWDDPRGLEETFALLPLAAGLAAAEAVLQSAGVEALLKWPNDLVHGRRKLGGILTEAVFRAGAPGHAVVGIGINVNHEETDFPEELRDTATSVRLITGRPGDREGLLARLCQTLDSWYNSLSRGARDEVVRAYQDRMVFRPGAQVRVETSRGAIRGAYRGLTAQGRLRLDRAGRQEFLSFEEIQSLDWES
jgi:BirA family biotin operon repressor/biotin-[acetyl-CoA-carboxylase] ligase